MPAPPALPEPGPYLPSDTQEGKGAVLMAGEVSLWHTDLRPMVGRELRGPAHPPVITTPLERTYQPT
jgi:hypothetical protein